MKKEIKNKTASIKAKLLNIAKSENIDFDAVLLRYFQERFLYRLSISKYSKYFVLKGGLLLICLNIPETRPTIDIDFLAEHVKNDTDELEHIIKNISELTCNDGVQFDPLSIKSERIKENADYEGIRIKIYAFLGKARKRLQMDIAFGDVFIPKPELMEFPALLEEQPPKINVYSIESVISEKLEAMVKLSIVNSRMKDFYDIYTLSLSHDFNSKKLKEAIESTFTKRKTLIPDNSLIFKPEFYNDKERQKQWTAFLRKARLKETTQEFNEVMKRITDFIKPIIVSIKKKTKIDKNWNHEQGYWN